MEIMQSDLTCSDPAVRLPKLRVRNTEPFGHVDRPVRGFFYRLARLLVISGLCLVVLAVLGAFSAVVGMGPGCGEDARPSEARAALGAMKDRARAVYQRYPDAGAIKLNELGMGASELTGSYFKLGDYSCGGTPEKWWAQCENVFESEPRHLRMEANLVTGSASYNR